MVVALIAILAYFNAIPGAELFKLYDRAKGTFQDPNVFGPFLILPLLFLARGILTNRLRDSKWKIVGFLIVLFAIFLSFSRAAWGMSVATLAIDRIDWSGMPKQTFARPAGATGMIWRRGWIDGVDHFDAWWPESFRITEDYERGIISTGTRDWTDYRAEATIVPSLAEQFGLAARVQGLRRYYALLLGNDNIARLVRMDDTETVLAEIAQTWNVFEPITLAIEVRGSEITGTVNGAEILRASDPGSRLTGGGVGLVIEKGTLSCEAVTVG